MNQSDIKPRTCPRRKAREKAYQQVTTGFKLNFDWPRNWRPNIVTKGLGCVPLGWFGLESVIRDHPDHGKSNEPLKTFKRIDWSSPLMCYNPIDPITEPVPGHPNCGAVSVGSQKQNLMLLTEPSKLIYQRKKKDSKADISSLASLRIRPSLLGTLFFNLLGPKSDQHQFSPNNISRSSRVKVMRITKLITKGRILWSSTKFSPLFLKEMYGHQCRESVCRSWGLKG